MTPYEYITLDGVKQRKPIDQTSEHFNYITLNGKTVSKSRNLRGILTYARKADTFVYGVSLTEREDKSGRLIVRFDNGAWSVTHFASFSVLLCWIAARTSWRGARVWANAAGNERIYAEGQLDAEMARKLRALSIAAR